MTDTPKFTVVDRRKFRAEDDAVAEPAPSTPQSSPIASPGPTLVEAPGQVARQASSSSTAVADLHSEPEELPEDPTGDPDLPPAPTTEEFSFQKMAYKKAAERLEDLVRAQNPAAPAPEKIGFEHLVQQLYLSAMMQMGAGTPEGQRPRVDILGARQSIDLLAVVAEKTRGNLTATEERTLLTVIYELRLTFLELTRMIAAPQPAAPPPGGAKR